MEQDRFRGYREDVQSLVLGFESMLQQGSHRYYDVDQLEMVIDYYLDTHNVDMLDQSVGYAESLFPQSNSIRLRRSHQLCAHERYDEALAILQELERIEPENTDVLYTLGAVYSAMEQPRKSIQYYRRASVDGYQLGMVYGNIADEYVKLGQEREAVAYYRKSLISNPEDERSIANLANCYESAGEFDKSIDFFGAFVQDHPYAKTAWFCLGSAYLAESLFERAIDAFEYALAIDKTYVLAYISLAETFRLAEMSDKAVDTLHESLDYVDDKAAIYYNIASIFLSRNNPCTAAIYFRKAVAEDPYFGDAWADMANCYSLMEDYSAALDCATRAVKINPQSSDYLMMSARIHDRFGHPELAQPLYDCGANMAEDYDPYWIEYVDFLIRQEQFHDAIEIIQMVIAKSENPFPFNLRLSVCCFRVGRRNFLYNALRACVHDNLEQIDELFELCPEMADDYDVMNIITTYRNEL